MKDKELRKLLAEGNLVYGEAHPMPKYYISSLEENLHNIERRQREIMAHLGLVEKKYPARTVLEKIGGDDE